MRVHDFEEWVNKSKRGSKKVYYTWTGDPFMQKDIMDAARKAYSQGKVTMVQRKIKAYHYEYIAVKL